ncbi:MAG: hypothetical protein CFE41_21530 [Burkholderiales bacterium PBB2]|nr:MAG: hypothetical protein CFE41_21530 [Burkholderiales bacterium PBB2]
MQNGKVIDGYVSGATVWLDINGNHIKDADEPSTVSKAAGAYQLELSEPQRACLPYSTLYVDVPVGAVDEDSGPVKEAYQMAIAPQFQPISVDQVLNISPLTTAIWDQVRTRITANDPKLSSCEQLRQNQSLREAMINEIKTVMGDLVRRHNLSEARIHDDFIKSKDTQSYTVAQDIVKGLKAGYAHKQKLHAQYPDASYVRAEVYRGRGSNSYSDVAGVWYRNSSVWRPAGYLNEWVVLSEDLSKIQRVLNLRRQDEQAWGSAKLKTTRTAYNFESNVSSFRCVLDEAIEQVKDGVTYELVVQYNDPKREDDPQTCFQDSHAKPSEVGLREYYAHYIIGKVGYTNNLRFDPQQPEHIALKDWFHLQGKSSQLDFNTVIARIAASGIRFDEEVKITPFSSWYKRSTDDTGLRVTIEKSDTGSWARTSTLADGTSRKECSADQGKTWGSCGG